MKRVYLEISDSCNLNCPFCSYPKGNTFLSLKEIDNYTTQIKEFCDYIYLHILGEPLLHPDFNNILDILDAKELKLQLVTNGTLLDRYPDLLKHSCLRKLSVSLHSINNIEIDESYFETIRKLISKDTKTVIELRFYDSDNLSERLKQFLNELKKEYNVSETKRNNSYKLKENVYFYSEELFDWPNINDPIINDVGTCHGAIDMIAINSHSKVTVCCLDPKAYNCIGDLKKNTLKDILESDAYKQYIEDFRNRKISSELCKRCRYRLRF
ncbi:MAG: radical SAM protein [Erysipelotrichaceae bacterium]|nr:radical SAM protein [Erysipelotrichaceae bacterium]